MSEIDELLPHLNWLDDQQHAMLSLIEELANINSGTFNAAGIAEVQNRLIREFQPLGGELDLTHGEPWTSIGDDGNEVVHTAQPSIHIVKRSSAQRRVMLCIHADTVFGSNHPFQKCRWLENGYLNGPGVVDAKGGLVVMLYALKTLEQSPFAERLGWDVIINPDEEIGSPGSTALMQRRATECDFAMLFEPSLPDGAMISWRKGSGNFTFVCRGKSAHAGRDFHDGRNAIVALSKLLNEIDGLNVDRDTTFNVGRVTGGGPLNMVPDLAIGRINVRVKTARDQETAENGLRKIVRQFSSELDGIEVEMHGEFRSPPKPLDGKLNQLMHQVELCGTTLGISITWQGTGGACDGNKFAAFGLPNIDTFGPCGGNLHRSDEYLIPESLIPRTKLAAMVLLSGAVHPTEMD